MKNLGALTADDTSMDGASADGGNDGAGILYVGEEVLGDSPTVTAISPVSIIFPKSVLETPTTISLGGGYPTSLEVAWSTTKTVTSGSITTVTSTITRYIILTTISLEPIVTGTINYHNWNISDVVTSSVGIIIPRFEIPSIVVTDDPNPMNETGVTHTPLGTRIVNIPPWPWTTDKADYPTVTFTQGDPAGPICTANCGHRCYSFCTGPCLSDCGSNSSSGFIDPLDTDAPSVSKCSGPVCSNGKCAGDDLCIERGCTGNDCHNRICTGDDCIPTACIGADCVDGYCSGDDCQDHGCTGSDCDGSNHDHETGGGSEGGSGQCFGLLCLSWGCTGLMCSSADRTCTGPQFRVVTCSGTGCSNGVCTGEGCKSEDSNCKAKEADTCTEWISSTLIAPASTHSTTTVTSRCSSITACAAVPTTVTSTVSLIDTVVPDNASMASWLDDQLSSYDAQGFATTTITTKSTTSTSTTCTTTTAASPTETSYDCKGSSRCGTFPSLHSFCNMTKASFTETTLYGTKDSDTNSGTCYTDGKNAGFGCGIFVEGDDCEMTGEEIAAAYDHIFQVFVGNSSDITTASSASNIASTSIRASTSVKL
ncbi:hypothetical protein N7491_010036 [Penicillium cf. griseofulvum]|uniref:Uncharacterized protein n=1 Tax=Penicillium cf. griseofulvum TaxID=2972120 RepID=A0A9W9T5G2_9EURO|nr:hypothetical protein N7472_000368 [Penicillium cf. griseofulvum]KAJ5421591.1 hypothetical protein N7491_010036 [Penicillium cf. griseofulvum]KAJ5424830.1 hypothetical protein N7445_010803 [Penicillium cf. griseofulvum]